jgi:hypothetical protein
MTTKTNWRWLQIFNGVRFCKQREIGREVSLTFIIQISDSVCVCVCVFAEHITFRYNAVGSAM